MGLREYQNRIQHVHKSAHAKYELCSCQERRVMTSLRQNRYLRIQGRMQIFRSISCFWMFNLQPFLDLINSKYCTHEYNILNFSDLEKVDKTFFKITKYQSEKKHNFLAKEFWSQCHILRIIYVLYMYYMCFCWLLLAFLGFFASAAIFVCAFAGFSWVFGVRGDFCMCFSWLLLGFLAQKI